jgi:hypothetical protein
MVLITGGPAALWEKVKEDLSNLKAMVIDAIQDWLITTIIKSAATKLLSMFNPAGAIVQAILMIYNVVMFVIERASQIMTFVEAIINSVHAIATGAIGGAAAWIERSLANAIPLVIGFLAALLGLGGITKKVRETIEKVQGFVWNAIEKAAKKIIDWVKKKFASLLKGKDKKKDERTKEEKIKAEKDAIAEADKLLEDEEITTADVQKKLGGIKTKYKLTSLTIQAAAGSEEGEEIDRVEAAASPALLGPPIKKLKPHPSKTYVMVVGKKYMLRTAYQNKTFTRDMCYGKSFRANVIAWKNNLLSKPVASGGLRHPTKLDHYKYCGQYYKNAGKTIASLDHKHMVVTHWNNTGRKTTQADRKNWYNTISNLKIVPLSINSSAGASAGQNYNYRVTINFRYP